MSDERLDRHRCGRLGATIAGIQTAITRFTFVMVTLMITWV
jgi:hypothetical protein